MANALEDIEFGEGLFYLAILGIVLYFLIKYAKDGLSGLDSYFKNLIPGTQTLKCTAANAATGQLTSAQIAAINAANEKDVQAIVARAYQTSQAAGDAAAAYAAKTKNLVANFATWSQPLDSGHWYVPNYSSDYIVPGTGQSIYTLRSLGYSDSDILALINQSASINPLNTASCPWKNQGCSQPCTTAMVTAPCNTVGCGCPCGLSV